MKNPNIGICGLAYKKNTNLSTRSPGLLLYNYFKKNYKVFSHDEHYPDIKIKNFEKDIEIFAKKSDVIFVCYPNNNFQKLGKLNYKKNILIIDLWNFIKTSKKQIKLKNVGIS